VKPKEATWFYRLVDDEDFDYQKAICDDCYHLLIGFGTGKEIFARILK
jgi:hypothetical protein